MNSTNMTFIGIGSNRYAIDMLNPMDAIAWGNRALALFGPALGKVVSSIDFEKLQGLDLSAMGLAEVGGKMQSLISAALASCGELKAAEATAMMTDALQRCYTPQNEPLADAAVFNSWFRDHPGDLYPLGIMALVKLVKDFFPSQLATAVSALGKSADTR